jgi:hypothetical protein
VKREGQRGTKMDRGEERWQTLTLLESTVADDAGGDTSGPTGVASGSWISISGISSGTLITSGTATGGTTTGETRTQTSFGGVNTTDSLSTATKKR